MLHVQRDCLNKLFNYPFIFLLQVRLNKTIHESLHCDLCQFYYLRSSARGPVPSLL